MMDVAAPNAATGAERYACAAVEPDLNTRNAPPASAVAADCTVLRRTRVLLYNQVVYRYSGRRAFESEAGNCRLNLVSRRIVREIKSVGGVIKIESPRVQQRL